MQTPMRVAVKTLTIYVDPDIEALREAIASLDVPSAIFHGVHNKSATLDDAKSIATNVLKDGTFISCTCLDTSESSTIESLFVYWINNYGKSGLAHNSEAIDQIPDILIDDCFTFARITSS